MDLQYAMFSYITPGCNYEAELGIRVVCFVSIHVFVAVRRYKLETSAEDRNESLFL